MSRHPGKKDERLEGRDGEIWRLYCTGRTQESLANQFGVSQSRVAQILKDVRAMIPAPDRDEARLRMLEVLDHLGAKFSAVAEKSPHLKYNNKGDIMVSADGTPALDHSEQRDAAKLVLEAQKRAAAMLGLDAPSKVEHSVDQVALEAARRLAGDVVAELDQE